MASPIQRVIFGSTATTAIGGSTGAPSGYGPLTITAGATNTIWTSPPNANVIEVSLFGIAGLVALTATFTGTISLNIETVNGPTTIALSNFSLLPAGLTGIPATLLGGALFQMASAVVSGATSMSLTSTTGASILNVSLAALVAVTQ